MSSTTTAAATYGLKERNASPPVSRIISSSCGAYATDDSASDAKIGRAIFFGSRWSSITSDDKGSPMRMRFAIGESADPGSRLSLVTAGETTPVPPGNQFTGARVVGTRLWRGRRAVRSAPAEELAGGHRERVDTA